MEHNGIFNFLLNYFFIVFCETNNFRTKLLEIYIVHIINSLLVSTFKNKHKPINKTTEQQTYVDIWLEL